MTQNCRESTAQDFDRPLSVVSPIEVLRVLLKVVLMAGDLFVTQGDISEFQADAVVCPTSTHLGQDGFAYQAFARRFAPSFETEYAKIREQAPLLNKSGRRASIGDTFWISIGSEEDRLRGIILVAVTRGSKTITIAERAEKSVRSALGLARTELRKVKEKKVKPGDRWLVAFPAIGLGHGGYSRELKEATEAIVRTAHAEIQAPEKVGDVDVEIDVAIVTFAPINYRLFLDGRRTVGVEPPCPLDTSHSSALQELLASLRERRCVLFAGAGLSRGAGLPDWGGLLRELAAELGLDIAKLPRESSGQLSLDLCLDLAQWYTERFTREKLDQRVHDRFGWTEKHAPAVRPTLAHYLLSALPFRLFLTTNYDDLFERTLMGLRRDPQVVCQPEAVVHTGQANRPCVVKLHGDATKRTPVVLTRDDFDAFFRNHPVTAALLEGLLLNHTFLFVGYDLRDPNTRKVYSGVAHWLRKAGTRAYSVVVREEDMTSKFYEDQWRSQGLITLRIPGPNPIHNSLRFFDWLARETCEVQSFLHPDLRRKDPEPEQRDLEELRGLLYKVSDELVQALKAGAARMVPEDSLRILAEVLELVTKLGWQPTIPGSHSGVWVALAQASHDPRTKEQLLRRALSVAQGVSELNEIREQIKGLCDAQLGHPTDPDSSSAFSLP